MANDEQTLRDQLASLAEENRSLSETATAHEILLETHSSTVSRLQETEKTVAEHLSTINSLKEDNSSLKGKHSTTTRELDESRTKAEELSVNLKDLKESLTAHVETIATLTDANRNLTESTAVLEKIKLDHASSLRELSTSRSTIDQHEKTIASLSKGKESMSDLTAANEKLKADLDNLKVDHDVLIAERESSQLELEKALSTTKERGERISELQKEMEGATSARTIAAETSLEALQLAHDLDRSQHAAEIRALETALHETTSRVHLLSVQLSDMHAAWAAVRKERDDAFSEVLSPAARSSKSYFFAVGDESPSGAGPSSPRIPHRPVDANLPMAVRHKRQVSLTALKARMGPSSRRIVSLSRLSGMDAVGEEDGKGTGHIQGSNCDSGSSSSMEARMKQFGDEIMFSCPCCEGDLITL